MELYSNKFFDDIYAGALCSAREIVPLVLEYVQPRSVIDVGCGIGVWLSVFKEFGVKEIFGIDGPWIEKNRLLIPEACFRPYNLEEPFLLAQEKDLAVSLEVAEHLPAQCAENFVDSLVALAPVILFSAAIPFQGGVNHQNEQWPEYWVHLFEKRGYAVIDCIRHKIWNNDNVQFWYRQNILIFLKYNELDNYPLLRDEFDNSSNCPLSIIHPQQYLNIVDYRNFSLRKILSVLPFIIKKTIKARAMKVFKISNNKKI